MRLSESLRRGIMETSVGGIINKLKVRSSRRNTLFFEDILAEYIKECEKAGYGKEMQKIGEQWGMLTAKILLPQYVKKLPLPLFSKVVKMVWVGLGIMDDVEIKNINDQIVVFTKKEAITRIIGGNVFSTGSYGGILSIVFNSCAECVIFSQSKEASEYVYRITNNQSDIYGKSKADYNAQNFVPKTKGYTLKDAIKNNTFQVSTNRIYFREKSLCNIENTLFHIIGNHGILLESVPEISYGYFSGVLNKGVSKDRALLLLKTLLQVMGWGIVAIIKRKHAIIVDITYPPCGLQSERDNWEFLINTILGYLRVIDRRFKTKDVVVKKRRLVAIFDRD